LAGRKTLSELWRQSGPMRHKAGRQLLKEFAIFPLLAGPSAPFVFAGNLSANLIRNVWAFLVIFCGHFPDGVEMFDAGEAEHENEAAWFVRQIRSSANVEGGWLFHVLTGHLSHQIEHHLFPDMPACRYAEIAPRVQAICVKYGLPYNTGTFWEQYGSVLKKLFVYALPDRATAAPLAA